MKKLIIIVITFLITLENAKSTYAYDFMYEDDVYSMCEEICKPYHISPSFVMAVIWKESKFATDAENGPCKGLMQINETSHRARMERLGVTDLFNPYQNIQVGVDLLAELFEQYEDDGIVLDLYNGNQNAFANYDKGKISGFSKAILDKSVEYERRYLDDGNGIYSSVSANRLGSLFSSVHECT